MSLYEKILIDLKNAIKDQDKEKLSVLRGIKSAIKNKQVEFRKELTEDQVLGVISSSGSPDVARFRPDCVAAHRGTRHGTAAACQ